jgi:ubiquinone/menaquinone biosynthesis C-methylase UbiE
VLDLGCGLGFTTALLAFYCEAIDIVGVDIDKHSTWDELKDFGCDFCICDAASLPFQSESFDVIVSFGAMEHTESEIEFLKEANRSLLRGGYNIVFQLPNKYSLSEYFGRKIGLWHHERTYSSREIRERFKICGFDITYMAREHLIPAQVHRISRSLGNILDKNHREIYKLDVILCKRPFSLFSQDHKVISRKQ